MINSTDTQSDIDLICVQFSKKAQAVSAIVSRINSFDDALAYTVDLCGKQSGCRIAVSGCEEHLSPPADALCHLKRDKIVAAPGLDQKRYAVLENLCTQNGISCIRKDLRSCLSGIDIGFTVADLGIAETGSLVISCAGEDLRLTTMICEYHVCVVHRKNIYQDTFAAEQQLLKFFHKTPNYSAFITGASRTADIERILALGVHGPLELHILLLED